MCKYTNTYTIPYLFSICLLIGVWKRKPVLVLVYLVLAGITVVLIILAIVAAALGAAGVSFGDEDSVTGKIVSQRLISCAITIYWYQILLKYFMSTIEIHKGVSTSLVFYGTKANL